VRLESFEKEGKVLAKQHSDMLATVRKSKGEMKARDASIELLTATKTAQVAQIADLQGRLAAAEGSATTAGKSLGAMQVASQASADKLTRLELELAAKHDEVASGRRALEQAWEAAKVAKRELAAARATTEGLQSKLEGYSGKLKETTDSQRDVESREAMLKANNTQLQESMQRHMTESGQREGRLREELRDMRQRWQEVVAARESLAGELSSSSAPLLAQISKLQETLRAKAEAWSGVESSLSERALRAESTLSVAEERRNLAEEARSAAVMQLTAQTLRLEDARTDLAAFQAQVEGAKAAEAGAMARVTELESRMTAELTRRAALERGVSDLEGTNRRMLSELKEAEEAHTRLHSVLSETEQERDEWKQQTLELQGDINLRRISSDGAFTPLVKGGAHGNGDNTRHTKTKSRVHTRQGVTPYNDTSADSMYGENSGNTCDDSDPELSALESRDIGSATALKSLRGPEVLPSGELSYAASMRLEQAVRRREEEIDELASKVRTLETSREALLKEVTFLSSRNAQLEEELEKAAPLSETLRQAKHSQNLLLLMVGEKEEEIESLRGDIADVKDLYREQLNAMVEAQVARNGGGVD
jgi:chromosome segregation ATPase